MPKGRGASKGKQRKALTTAHRLELRLLEYGTEAKLRSNAARGKHRGRVI